MQDDILHTYNPIPTIPERGEGALVWDREGNQYLDLFCGIAVTGLGHNHPAVTKAIQQQAEKILHTSNLFEIKQAQDLAGMLAETTGMSCKTFFCNSGGEAVEGLIKFARAFGHSKNIDVPKMLVTEKGFHGRTMAAISASGSPKYHEGFTPMLEGFIHVPYNDVPAMEAMLKADPDIVAIMIEPIQGEGGINVPDANYLSDIRELCTKHNILMFVDEIQTGMARTGQLFAYQHNNIIPDGISLAKGLANGIPVGAFCIAPQYADVFKPGMHGSTFGGNPLATGAAIATLDTIVKEKLWENAAKQGEKLMSGLKEALKGNSHVKDIRGKGLMMGIEIDKPARGILTDALKAGLMFNVTGTHVVRLLPPLIINDQQVDETLNKLPQLIHDYTA